MTRREMVEELLEKLETELDELSNAQLSKLILEYEHAALLSNAIETLDELDVEDDDEEEEEDKEDVPLIDGDWDDTEETEEE